MSVYREIQGCHNGHYNDYCLKGRNVVQYSDTSANE